MSAIKLQKEKILKTKYTQKNTDFLIFYCRLCPEACSAPLGPFLQQLKDLQIPEIEGNCDPVSESLIDSSPTQKYLRFALHHHTLYMYVCVNLILQFVFLGHSKYPSMKSE